MHSLILLFCACAAKHALIAPDLLPDSDDGSALVAPPKVLWSTRVGLTNARSTIAVDGDRIVLGSSSGTDDDPLDGLWVLDAKHGTSIAHVVPPGGGGGA